MRPVRSEAQAVTSECRRTGEDGVAPPAELLSSVTAGGPVVLTVSCLLYFPAADAMDGRDRSAQTILHAAMLR